MSVVLITVGGFSLALYQEGRGAALDVQRGEAQLRALAMAEAGIARAELEVGSGVDAAGNGLGALQGSYAGGTFAVTATQTGGEYTLVSTGKVAGATRRIEAGCRRRASSVFEHAVFAKGAVSLTGTATTDAYDSRLGTYASQATNSDADGMYAQAGGDVGSNAGVSNTGRRIRGDATPGPTYSVTGGGVVTGSTAPAAQPLAFPPPPLSAFTTAYTTNNNGNWNTGAGIVYNAITKTLNISSGVTCTLPGGTYFFSTLIVAGNATIRFTGPSTIYTTVRFDTAGGSLVNTTGYAGNVVIYAHPYDFPSIAEGTSTIVNVSGGAGAAFCLYGPQSALTIAGGSDVFGSLMAGTASITAAKLHYDLKLGAGSTGRANIERTYWLDRSPPR